MRWASGGDSGCRWNAMEWRIATKMAKQFPHSLTIYLEKISYLIRHPDTFVGNRLIHLSYHSIFLPKRSVK